ncbi:MAG TPA: hypothetical protein VGH28_30570 [Polyangiaceae bacterium]|jgi:hypothetical protein
MRRIFLAAALVCSVFAPRARADDGQSVPLAGQSDPSVATLDQIAAALDHRTPDDERRAEAERRLRADGDAGAVAGGSVATSLGVTMLATGIALASKSDLSAADCPTCIPAVLLSIGGAQLLLVGLVDFLSYGGSHAGRHHARYVRTLARAMDHVSPDDARASRRRRLAAGWSLVISGTVLVAGAVTLFAIGHAPGVDDDTRMALGGASAFVGSWLTAFGADELATKWMTELAFTPARSGAVFSWSRSF